jgi:hypothetical protein
MAPFNPFVLLLLFFCFLSFFLLLLLSLSLSGVVSWCVFTALLCLLFLSLAFPKLIRSLRCDRRPQDTCQDVRLGLFGLIWVAAFRRKCSDGFKVMPKKTKTGSPIYTIYFFILSLSWSGLAWPPSQPTPAAVWQDAFIICPPNFNCYVSVYITLFCLLDVTPTAEIVRQAWINVIQSAPKKDNHTKNKK